MTEKNPSAPPIKNYGDEIFQNRLKSRYDELYMLYSTIYHDDKMFDLLISMLYELYTKRPEKQKKLDTSRLNEPKWYCKNDSIAVQFYAEKFAGNLKKIETKIDYLKKLGVKIIHILPLLKSPKGKSDGGFACSDYRNVREDLGTIDDLEHLINMLHENGMCFAMDFIINHTSDEHEWAKKAKKGEIEYQKRYYFYDSWYEPNQFDSYGNMGHFFGDMAPDNFTFVPECQKIVMTTFYSYQWDLNYSNPIVFHQMLNNILYLMNLGVDIIIFNATQNLWKKPGTGCRNLPQAYLIIRMIDIAMEIVCPAGAALYDIKRHKKQNQENNHNIHLNSNTFVSNENALLIDDESESENEQDFIITDSGVITVETHAGKINSHSNENLEEEEKEEDLDIDFDFSIEIGKIHFNHGWIPRLWASLAFGSVHSISYSINVICNRFAGDCYLVRVHEHDDINWGYGFDVENSSLIGNGKGSPDGFRGGIISQYRYLNDFYQGNMPGTFSRGITFAEDIVTGKARICGTTASLLGLESALDDEKNINQKIQLKKEENKALCNSLIQKLNNTKRDIQAAIDRILLLHAVTFSMPCIATIYSGDEIGLLNDYSYVNYPDICQDTRYLQRGNFDWESAKLIDTDKDSYQAKIFNGLKELIDARLKCPYFAENEKTIFFKNYSKNEYFQNDQKNIYQVSQEYEIDDTLLIFKRLRKGGKFLIFVFNFCQNRRPVHISQKFLSGKFREIITGKIYDQINDFSIQGYGYHWFEPIED